MKKVKYLVTLLAVIFLIACSGSDTYRGDWKATNVDGEQYNLTFNAKSFTVTNTAGEVTNYNYTQNSVNIKNSVETYGLNLEDGRKYQLNFPLADDESVGLLLDSNGKVLYAISRDNYITYDDIFALD
ncbi:hypothetical protein [uncultured Maribacter sp.]|uniref:hypothetical protein n=1 Tax=uncultured Maribacter sp. TaxID=431308 RepID=UPI002612CC0A|nr:hypothetical protein [uncultured Maribacter sp.]